MVHLVLKWKRHSQGSWTTRWPTDKMGAKRTEGVNGNPAQPWDYQMPLTTTALVFSHEQTWTPQRHMLLITAQCSACVMASISCYRPFFIRHRALEVAIFLPRAMLLQVGAKGIHDLKRCSHACLEASQVLCTSMALWDEIHCDFLWSKLTSNMKGNSDALCLRKKRNMWFRSFCQLGNMIVLLLLIIAIIIDRILLPCQ